MKIPHIDVFSDLKPCKMRLLHFRSLFSRVQQLADILFILGIFFDSIAQRFSEVN